ncbi:hypothetical protein BTVI_58593 [Pitangus sulphuratus]|nr:hypothetical protein BTVI_58593 [Pitangus sulphuratus]
MLLDQLEGAASWQKPGKTRQRRCCLHPQFPRGSLESLNRHQELQGSCIYLQVLSMAPSLGCVCSFSMELHVNRKGMIESGSEKAWKTYQSCSSIITAIYFLKLDWKSQCPSWFEDMSSLKCLLAAVGAADLLHHLANGTGKNSIKRELHAKGMEKSALKSQGSFTTAALEKPRGPIDLSLCVCLSAGGQGWENHDENQDQWCESCRGHQDSEEVLKSLSQEIFTSQQVPDQRALIYFELGVPELPFSPGADVKSSAWQWLNFCHPIVLNNVHQDKKSCYSSAGNLF